MKGCGRICFPENLNDLLCDSTMDSSIANLRLEV